MPTCGRIIRHSHTNSEVRIVSSNVRGFHTNVGELTHRFILKNKADIVFVSETFLDDRVPETYARVKGYSPWIRKDRTTRGGGVALCYKENLNLQVINFPTPSDLEILIFKLIDNEGKGTLCCGCYRPPLQGSGLLEFLVANLDQLLTANGCENILIIGDLNQHIVQVDFDSMLAVFNLENHVTFPTHSSGSSLDPVVTDLPSHTVHCSPLGFVGSSDHVAVLTKINFKRPRERSCTRTLWRWEAADWGGLRADLQQKDWEGVLRGDIDYQVEHFTKMILEVQSRRVPHLQYRTKASDQPWFGPRCQAASDDKYKAWLRYKRHPTQQNKERHRQSAAHMHAMQAWAKHQWVENTKQKLRGRHVGTKRWWNLVKEEQGESREGTIPPLLRGDGSSAHSTQDKADLLAEHFSQKMTVPDPFRATPSLPLVTKDKLSWITLSKDEVHIALRNLEEAKAVGPDGISPRLLRGCARELTVPITKIYNMCLQTCKWPESWKVSHIVPIHKKNNKSDAKNYRPISLLSVLSKVLESIISNRLTAHLDKHYLLCTRQFAFRKGHSASDLHTLLTNKWSSALDQGRATAVVALDIEGAFDRVWHGALVEKLRTIGVAGELLELLRNYLEKRYLRVVLNGHQSSLQCIGAGVPQGSVLGPLLWNIYINDLINLVPTAMAFADDITISESFGPVEETLTVSRMNATLRSVITWGHKWQVKFAPQKTKVLVVSRSQLNIRLSFDEKELTPQEEVEVLGVTYDSKLTFRTHIEQLTRTASRKLASLRRISWLLDNRGREVLYKAQIRSSLEYSCLAWGGAANKYLTLLNKIQDRAVRIIQGGQTQYQPDLHTLQHRRDVAGLTTLFKVQQQNVSHLQELRQPARQAQVRTRAAETAPAALVQPRCRTSHHQRQFVSTCVRWWNRLLASQQCLEGLTVQTFKSLVNKWLFVQWNAVH